MISLKELKYVGVPNYKAPYPGDDYAKETLETMTDTFCKYEEKYRGKDYSIVFSDSSELNFEILDTNICHMLGVDFSNLISGNYDKFLKDVLGLDRTKDRITSFELINRILVNRDKLIDYDNSTTDRIINYYKARIKCAIFERMSDFEKFNFAKLNTENESKILFTPSNEVNCPYFFIRLTPDNYNSKYCVSSLMTIENGKIPTYFGYAASIPTQILIDNNKNLSKLEATPGEKLALLNMYKSILLNYSLEDKMDISGDYMSLLTEMDIKQRRKTL